MYFLEEDTVNFERLLTITAAEKKIVRSHFTLLSLMLMTKIILYDLVPRSIQFSGSIMSDSL